MLVHLLMLCINSSLCVGDTHCCTAFICLFIYDMIWCFCLGKTEDVSYSKNYCLRSRHNSHFDWFKITNTFFLSFSKRFDSSQVAKPTYRLPIIIIIIHNATIFFSFLSTVILCRIINDGADDVLIPRI